MQPMTEQRGSPALALLAAAMTSTTVLLPAARPPEPARRVPGAAVATGGAPR